MKILKSARFQLIISMIIFGTIGVVRKQTGISSEFIALARGLFGSLVLLFYSRFRFNNSNIKENCFLLLASSVALGFNWIFLFEAYNRISVAKATLCYYTAPAIITAVSPLILKEKLTVRKTMCAFVSLVGMIFVSGVLGDASQTQLSGVAFGLGAAALYAAVVILNKKIIGIGAIEKTIIQLFTAGVILIPYNVMAGKIPLCVTHRDILVLAMLGIIHTGFAYALYFGAVNRVSIHTAAILSYVDPIIAVLLSIIILKEHAGAEVLLGAAFVLGSAYVSERE